MILLSFEYVHHWLAFFITSYILVLIRFTTKDKFSSVQPICFSRIKNWGEILIEAILVDILKACNVEKIVPFGITNKARNIYAVILPPICIILVNLFLLPV